MIFPLFKSFRRKWQEDLGRTMNQRWLFQSLIIIIVFTDCIPPYANAEEIEIRYATPKVTMKLIIVDDNVKVEQFKTALDKVVQMHLVNFFLDKLPADTDIINRNQFKSVTLTSTIERVPVEIEDNSTAVRLSIMHSDFEGFGSFTAFDDDVYLTSVSKELINNTTDLRPITFDAFRQRLGFWQFADLIIANNFLAVTGRLQIEVENVIVGEADLQSDRPVETNDVVDEDTNLSILEIALISVACFLFICIGGIGALIYHLRHREYEIEKKSRERRDLSKQVRMKGLGNSSASLAHSISSNGGESFVKINTATAAKAHTDRLERRASASSIPSMKMRVESQRSIESKESTSSASLLDSIAEESTNLEFEMINLPTESHPNTFQDDDGSEFYSVQSASERDESIDLFQNARPNKNVIDKQSELRPIKRASQTSIGSAPLILKPAIKNSHEGQQYVKDTTRKYISYNTSFSASSLAIYASPRSSQKLTVTQKMNSISSIPSLSKSSKSVTNGKSIMPPLSPSRAPRCSTTNNKVRESPKRERYVHTSKGRYNDQNSSPRNEEAFDDGMMIGMSCSNLSFDIMDGSNSDQASLSPPGKSTKGNHDDDCANSGSDQNSMPFYFT